MRAHDGSNSLARSAIIRHESFPRLKKRLSRRLGIRKLDWLAGRQLDDTLAKELEDQLLLADVLQESA